MREESLRQLVGGGEGTASRSGQRGLSSNGAAYRSRGYQLEMLEASRKENIIVAVCPLSEEWH
jgi:hypothetical protein